jgi:starch synthase
MPGCALRPINVLFAAAEVFPLAKTGGLADVCGALPQALWQGGINLRVIMPGYGSTLDQLDGVETEAEIGELLGVEGVRILRATLPGSGVPVWLVDAPSLFRREGGLYQAADGTDWPDNARRFALFAHAVAAVGLDRIELSWRPDIVHCHDWHAGLVPLLLQGDTDRPATLFTIHNLAYQGNFPGDMMDRLRLPAWSFRPDGLEFHSQISFLKAGLVFADGLTTVSPGYAKEIQTPAFGCGMDGLLRLRANDLDGILNGIDTELWNPASDPWVGEAFSRHELGGKAACKSDLQAELRLDEDATAPLIISASRLTHQKMIDVTLKALPGMLTRWPKMQFALLGRGDRVLEQGFHAVSAAFPGRVAIHIGYDEPRAHRFHAGGDILLHGSRFEPCGLAQLYAMRYGTVPVVRRIGGLADTVCDVSPEAMGAQRATGFVFEHDTAEDMAFAVGRAISLYDQGSTWRTVQIQGMARDHGWEASARAYSAVYQRLLFDRGASPETGRVDGRRELAASFR